jgi:hypothetical protein
MITVNHRPPVAKFILIQSVIELAYYEVNNGSRHHYASVFHELAQPIKDNNEDGEKRIAVTDSRHPVNAVLGSKSPSTVPMMVEDSPPPFKPLFFPVVTFPPPEHLHLYSWKKLFATYTEHTVSVCFKEIGGYKGIPECLYLHPKFLDRYERVRSAKERFRLLAIMHCVVAHELAHLLHYKVYKTIDCVASQEGGSVDRIDYGTEVEHRLFGGRMLSTVDFAGLRIERKNGEVYEMDPNYFVNHVMDHRNVDFDRLSKVDVDVDRNVWMGMGEINGTH